MKTLKDKKLLVLISSIIVLVLILVGILIGCRANKPSESEKEPIDIETIIVEDEKKEEKNEEKQVVLEDKKEDSKKESKEETDKTEEVPEKGTTQKNNSEETTKPNTSTPNKTPDNKTPTSTHTHTWISVYKTVTHPAETKQVWVVDKAAYTEEVPVYETKYVNVCNEATCAIAFYGWTQDEASAHVKAHMLVGEQGGYHKEYRDILVGHKTVTHPEEGHYNTVVVKEAYTEEVLSGYKCSCGATK